MITVIAFIIGLAIGFHSRRSPNVVAAEIELDTRFHRPKVLFHGGCHGCNSQEINGITRCESCRYFACDWALPDLNNEHSRLEREMEAIRYDVRVRNLIK